LSLKETDRIQTKENETMKTTPQQITAFAQLMQRLLNGAGYGGVVYATVGPKFAKFTWQREGNGGESVAAFITMATGDIHKPKDYRAPTKQIRGNVNNPDAGASALYPEGHIYAGMVVALR
jgi:hypothetical protein